MNHCNTKHISCETCVTRKNSLFSSLENGEITHLDQSKKCSFYKKNDPLFIEGSIPRGVFCIHDGKVKVFTRGKEGKDQIVYVAKQGEIVGFRALFSGDPYVVSAATLEESNICFVSKADFLDMMDNNHTLRNGVMKELSKELASRAEFITEMAQKSVRERLASILLILQDFYEDEPINFTREDLANFVGTASETLIRLLKEFKEDGIISSQGRKITVLDKGRLLQIH